MPRGAWIFIILAALCFPATVRAWEVIVYDGRRHVPIEDLAAFYQLKEEILDGKKFVLSSANKKLTGQAGTREIIINNVKLILCFPIVEHNGRILISGMDVSKIIEPVMRPGKIKNVGTLTTVVLDAGHGGNDSGATSVYGREKDFTLDVALRTRKLLLQQGYQVRMTRQSDELIPLETRAAIANRCKDAVFISIHFNKSNTPGGNGIETYALAPRGVPSMDAERVSFSDLREHAGNVRDPENIALATLMHSAMLRNLRLFDRGIKRARFLVIREVTIPGVLLEGGFVDKDGPVLATPDYRQRMAQSITEAIGNYKHMVAHEGGELASAPPPAPAPEVSIPTQSVVSKGAAALAGRLSISALDEAEKNPLDESSVKTNLKETPIVSEKSK